MSRGRIRVFSSNETESRLTGASRISRRDLLGGAAALAFGGSVSTEALAADQPKPGGRVRIAMGDSSTSDTLDPALLNGNFQYILSRALRSTLRTRFSTRWVSSGSVARYSSTDAKFVLAIATPRDVSLMSL